MPAKINEIECVTGTFTIFFEDLFWVGILEEKAAHGCQSPSKSVRHGA
jgi:hypothetical protein